MNNNLRVRALVIVAVLLVCVYFIIGIPKSKAEILENWHNNIHLGLDLRGGSQLILQVNLQDAFKATADVVIEKMKDAMRAGGIEYTDIDRNDPQTLESADSIQINVTGIGTVELLDHGASLRTMTLRSIVLPLSGMATLMRNGIRPRMYRSAAKREKSMRWPEILGNNP